MSSTKQQDWLTITWTNLPGSPQNTSFRLQVRAISAKLLELRAALGNRPDVDVGAMLIACPQLLRLELPDMMQRLLTMQVGVSQPALQEHVQLVLLQFSQE